MGRASWDGQSQRRILEKWQLEEPIQELTKAGFARGDREYLELLRANLNNLSDAAR